MNKLTKRQLSEQKFHDKWALSVKKEDIFYNEAFEAPSALENQFILSKMGYIQNKSILDLGCGIGDASIYFAKKGAFVTSVDISPKMIALVKRHTDKMKLKKNIKSQVMVSEHLTFPSSSFDFVYGNGILHHVDFLKTASEIKKVLKKGGEGYFIEPLSYNPIIELYRKIARKVRTDDEKPLSLHDIEKFGSNFNTFYHSEFHLFTLLIYVWFFLVLRLNPNKVRYWKKFLADGHKYKTAVNFLAACDKLLLRFIPFINRFCWTTVIRIQN